MIKSICLHQYRTGFIFCMVTCFLVAVGIGFIPEAFAGTSFQVSRAEWKAGDGALKLKGYGAGKKKRVFVKDAASGKTIGSTRSEDDGKFEFEKEHLSSVPSALSVESLNRSVMIGFTETTRKRGGKAVLILESKWKASRKKLVTKGQSPPRATVKLISAQNGTELGSIRAKSDGTWKKTIKNPPTVPCRIRIELDGAVAEMAVKNAPENCGAVTPAPADPVLTGISVSGPPDVTENTEANYTVAAAYDDGSTRDVTALSLWHVNDSSYAEISGNGLITFEVPANQQVFLSVTYEEDEVIRSDTFQVTILDQSIPLEGSHANRFSAYEGTSTCLNCHTTEAMAVHGSVHYQWKGDASETVGLKPGDAGKLGGINDFCIYPDINWIGKLNNVSGQPVDGGCAKCHVGLGNKPEPTASRSQLENIDCLICHSDAYKRTVENVDGAYQFVPDTEKMGVTTLQAAVDITLPSNGRCLDCHTKAGGGNNFKRGDIEEAHRNATRSFDVHLASKQNGGAGLSCVDCHTASGHRIAGRGTDLRPWDSPDEVSCEKCHGDTPHDDRKLDKHTYRINCTVCHIPTFAKVAPTDMSRDWSRPGELNEAKGLYEPFNQKKSHVIPEYRFFNGMSYFYQFGDSAIAEENGFITMSAPMGSVSEAGARIYAFKHHLGNQPIGKIDRRLLPLKIGLFFETGAIDQAVQKGAEAVGWSYDGHEFARTERFMGLFHEVAPSGEALSCTDCHSGGSRMDFKALGYSPKQTYNGKALCAGCHKDESDEWKSDERFKKIHEKHVEDKKLDCSKCHGFSKAG